MSSIINVKCSDSYYPGYQKLSLFADPTIRRCAALFACYAFAGAVASRHMPAERLSMVEATLQLGAIFPFALKMGGGLRKDCGPLYAAFCALALAAALPAMMFEMYASLILAVPAFAALAVIAGRSSDTFKNLGLNWKRATWDEAALFVASLAVMAPLTMYAFVQIEGVSPNFKLPLLKYVTYFIYGVIFYGSAYTAMYGVLSKRVISMKRSITEMITINVAFHFMLAFPMAPYFGEFRQWAVGEASGAIMSQFFLGVLFHRSRSTSLVILEYTIFYVFYSVIFMAR